MVGIVSFHVVMLVLGVGIGSRVVPVERVSGVLAYLHDAIGISMPPMDRVRAIALIWIGSVIVIFDGSIFLLVFITKQLN
jgi:hypothetical protein